MKNHFFTLMDNHINRERESSIKNGFDWNGKSWDVNILLSGYVAAGIGCVWRDKENVKHTLTHEEAKSLLAAMMTFVQNTYSGSWDVKTRIREMDDPDAIRAEIGL